MITNCPLSNHPVLRTTEPETIKEFIASFQGGEVLRIDETPGDIVARVNWVSMGQSQYGLSEFGRAISMKFPGTDFLRVKLALAGNLMVTCHRETKRVDVTTGSISTGAVTVDCSSDAAILTYLVSKRLLAERLAALNDGAVLGELDFHHRLDLTTLVGQNFLHTLRSMLTLLSQSGPGAPVELLEELEQALITALLLASPLSTPSIATVAAKSVAPGRVRRAEAYLVENWRAAFDAALVADAAGTSPRNLFRLFREFRGYTPLEFLKKLRLERALARLRLSDDGVNVTEIALDCGWNSSSHFSKDFRDHYGLTPTEARRKAQD